MKKEVKWGILGLGKIARKFASDLQLVPGAVLQGVASRSLEKATTFKDEFKAQHAFGSYEALLSSGEIDIVYIATPHHLHMENSIAAAHQGLGVLCEKPAALNSVQLQEIIKAARSNNCYFMEALWTRFLPSTEKVLEILASGELGNVLEVEADFCFTAERNFSSRLFDLALGGGALLDIGIYPLFLAYQLLGVPQKIKADGQLSPTGSDESCSMTMSYEGGQVAQLHASVLYGSAMTARITCEKGYILLPGRWHEAQSVTVIKAGYDPEKIDTPFPGKGFYHQILSSQEAYLNGQIENEFWSHEDSLAIMKIMDEVRGQIGVAYAQDRENVVGQSE